MTTEERMAQAAAKMMDKLFEALEKPKPKDPEPDKPIVSYWDTEEGQIEATWDLYYGGDE